MAALAQSTENAPILTAENHNTELVAELYRNIIDWKRWFTIVHQLGDQCNGRKDRFDKADILEQAIEVCSNERLTWVDGIGRDHHDNELNLDIEFKYANSSMFSFTTKKPRRLVKMKIKNSLGETRTNEIQDPADYYMFAQQDAVGIISYAEMLPYLDIVPDGLMAKIPHDKITYIITPQNEIFDTNIQCMNYKQRKRAMQREFIMSIPPSTEFETTEDTPEVVSSNPEVHLSDLERANLLAVIAASEAEHNYSNAKSETSQ
jgi:hypothetical protein